MTINYSTQARLFPFSGTTTFADGDGMHSRIPYDMPRMLNNLMGYVDAKVGYCQDPTLGYIATEIGNSGTSQEWYVAQVPTLVPRTCFRMVYTLGNRLTADSTKRATVTATTVYLSGQPYLGPSGSSAFDTGFLTPGYAASTTAQTFIASSNTTSYVLTNEAGDSSGIRYPPFWKYGNVQRAFIILTCTGASTGTYGGTSGRFSTEDFSWWFLYE